MLTGMGIESRRKKYYRENLKQIKALYEPAIGLQNGKATFSDCATCEFVLAPFLTLFTIWVLKSAVQDGVSRLYFLARDGYPAYKMACKLCDAYKIGIECRYLYCSRYSLRVPMYSENTEEMLEYVCRNGLDVSVRKILKRTGLQEDRINQLIEGDLQSIQGETLLSYDRLREIRQLLGGNADFLKCVTENSRENWAALCGYFSQERLTENEHIGLVDSGWVGSTQKSVCDILKRMGTVPNIEGYYWGLYDIPRDMDYNRYHGFFFDKRKGLRKKLFFSNCLIEAVFSNTHGTAISYEAKGEKWLPILQKRCSNIDFITNLNGMLNQYGDLFVELCSAQAFDEIDVDESIEKLSQSLLRFMWDPTPGEAEFFGKLRFSDDLLDDSDRELGPVFTAKEIKENLFLNRALSLFGCKHGYIHESAWFFGTLRRSKNHIIWYRYSYAAYRLISYLKKSL